MKVAVYTIALNEEQFVEKWYESAKEADYLLIADTGSTDNTLIAAQKLGINVASISIKPWRFDDARNASLSLIPDDIDYCIALDMDEQLQPGWRKELEKAFENGWTRPRYKYTWSWNGDKPGLQYGGDKIHSRHNYRWKHPVHEVLITDRIEETQGWTDIEIHHHADNSKPRSQYLPLLELSTKEDPYDDRNAFYYARELYFYGRYQEAAEEFKRHLSLPRATWKPERAASMRYLAKCDSGSPIEWLTKAVAEDPGRREALVELGMVYYRMEQWPECYDAMSRAVAIKEKPLDYLCEDFAWGSMPYDVLSIAAYNLGKYEEAVVAVNKAISVGGSNSRLEGNLELYKQKLSN